MSTTLVPNATENYAWAAGIIDGEGFFGLYRRRSHSPTPSGQKKYKFMLLRVGQTSDTGIPEMITRLHDLFGGKVFGPYIYGNRVRPHWIWEVRHQRVPKVFALLEPWLGDVKREQYLSVKERFHAEE